MAKKRKAAAPVVEAPAVKHARAAGEPSTSGSGFKNKEKWLVVSSRGITFR